MAPEVQRQRCRESEGFCRALVNPSGKSERASGEMTLKEVSVRVFAIWGKGVQAGNSLCKVPGAGVGPGEADLDYAEWQD